MFWPWLMPETTRSGVKEMPPRSSAHTIVSAGYPRTACPANPEAVVASATVDPGLPPQWESRLSQQGVDTARLQAVGFGAHWSKVDAPSGVSAEDADRRVEVHATWYGPPGCTAHEIPTDKCPVACE